MPSPEQSHACADRLDDVREPATISEPERLSLDIPARTLDVIVDAAAARTLERIAAEQEAEPWPEWLSVETAARYLDVSPERLRKLQARREVPFYQEAPGCRVLFRRRELDEWMAAFRQPTRHGNNSCF